MEAYYADSCNIILLSNAKQHNTSNLAQKPRLLERVVGRYKILSVSIVCSTPCTSIRIAKAERGIARQSSVLCRNRMSIFERLRVAGVERALLMRRYDDGFARDCFFDDQVGDAFRDLAAVLKIDSVSDGVGAGR